MTQPVSPLENPPTEDGGGRDLLHDRRAIGIIAGAVAAVAALGYFVVLPMVSGGSSNTDASAPVVHHAATASPTPSSSAAPATPATPAPELNVRDPFSPLYAAPTAAASSAAASIAPVAAQQPILVPGPTQTVVVTKPGPTVTDTPAPTYTLTLVSLVDTATTKQAVVSLNGTKETVSVGQNFPDSKNGPFELTVVDSPTVATFMYGENSFAMAIGQTETAG